MASCPLGASTQPTVVSYTSECPPINRFPSQRGKRVITKKQGDRVGLHFSQTKHSYRYTTTLRTTKNFPRTSLPLHNHTIPHTRIHTSRTTTTFFHYHLITHFTITLIIFSFHFPPIVSPPPNPSPPATRLPSPTLPKARVQHQVAQNWALLKISSWGDVGMPRGPNHARALPAAPPPPSPPVSAPPNQPKAPADPRLREDGRNPAVGCSFRLLAAVLLRLLYVVFAPAPSVSDELVLRLLARSFRKRPHRARARP